MKIIEEKKRTPWDIYQSIHRPGGSGHGKRVLMSKEILKKKIEAINKKMVVTMISLFIAQSTLHISI